MTIMPDKQPLALTRDEIETLVRAQATKCLDYASNINTSAIDPDRLMARINHLRDAMLPRLKLLVAAMKDAR